MVGRTGSYVALQAVELTVVQGSQQFSGCSQHHPPLSQVPTLPQSREQCQLDVVQRLKQVEDLRHENNQVNVCDLNKYMCVCLQHDHQLCAAYMYIDVETYKTRNN